MHSPLSCAYAPPAPRVSCAAGKDPRFRPSMLEGPKPKFQTVTLTGGPIVKQHKPNKTGMETRRPYQWGPLGGYY